MKLRHFISIGLAACLLAVTTIGLASAADARTAEPAAQTEAGPQGRTAAEITNKDEVVYATLAATGEVDAIYAVNHFEVASAGNVTDYGDYESVVNLTNSDALTQDGDSISFQAEAGNYYYQGNMISRDLPWFFDFTYRLDGQSIAPQELAGRTGRLELSIASSRNEAADPVFYEHYMLQITVTLDAQTCSGIDAPDGTVASAGTDKIITYTVLPGSDANFVLGADVRDFTMTGIGIAAMPYQMSMDFPDTDEQLSELERLPDAIAQLNDGVGELKTGAEKMKNGAGELTSGSAGIRDGLVQLSANSAPLIDASAQINGALSQLAAALSGGTAVDISQISQLPQGLSDLAKGLREMVDGFSALKDSFQTAYGALDGAMQALPDASSADVQALYGALDPAAQADAVEALNRVVSSVATAKGAYDSVKPAFDAVGTTVAALSGSLDTMATTLEGMSAGIGDSLAGLGDLSQLGELAAGLSELSKNYAGFHEGLARYADGVNTLSSNYAAFHSGVASFESGVGELEDGVSELHDGTSTLNREVADMPDMIQTEIDEMKEDYIPSDFDPVSFTSPQNTDTDFVQFVLQCKGIEQPKKAEKAETVDQTETFWDRLVALFQ